MQGGVSVVEISDNNNFNGVCVQEREGRKQKQPSSRTRLVSPYPGSYNFAVERDNKIPKAYVPFGSMEPKTRDAPQAATLVGPGSYNLDTQHNGEKIIVSSET